MFQYEDKTVVEKGAVAITCDRCKTEYPVSDWEQCQEFHHIRFTGGYGSVFGDGTEVGCDLCQKCLYELIKSYMRTTTVW